MVHVLRVGTKRSEQKKPDARQVQKTYLKNENFYFFFRCINVFYYLELKITTKTISFHFSLSLHSLALSLHIDQNKTEKIFW